MSTFAVQFLNKGKVVDTQYVTAHNEPHAKQEAYRKTSSKEWDEVEASKL